MTKSSNNKKLRDAQRNKSDEFYTSLCDIEKEMVYYKDEFRGKSVYCNCDDSVHSNFVKYFVDNFDELGIKKIFATCYNKDGKGTLFIADDTCRVGVTYELYSNGDFRSDECVSLLNECDIVVTNPPFSLFREYVRLLMDHNKKFIVMGHKNAITYKEIFPYIKSNRLWLGASIVSGDREFRVPDDVVTHSPSLRVDKNGNKFIKVPGVCWFTNVTNNLRNTHLNLTCSYSSDQYPKYDNYDAIEVSKTCNIPNDYFGVMGVPITYLFKYCPEQFEIVGFFNNYNPDTANKEEGQIYGDPVRIETSVSMFRGPVVKGKAMYFRVLIKRLNINEKD